MTNALEPEVGDKIRVLAGEQRGARGVVVSVVDDQLEVQLDDFVVQLTSSSTHNYSLAARKAWRTRPNRAVGRPRNRTSARKRMVSLRISEEVWSELGRAVEAGLIESREAAVNRWLVDMLNQLRAGTRP